MGIGNCQRILSRINGRERESRSIRLVLIDEHFNETLLATIV